MSTERVRRKKNRWKYNIVLLPHEDAGKSWSFRIALWSLAASLFLYTVVVAALTVFFLARTPLGVWIPVRNPELEKRYGRQAAALQEQLDRIVSELAVLQHYNAKVRTALGSELTGTETNSTASTQVAAAGKRTEPTEAEKGNAEAYQYATDERSSPPLYSDDTHAPLALPTSNTESFRNSLPLRLPANGYITRGFEPSRGHLGIDIAGRQGSPVVAAADGYIVFAGWTYDAGNMMIIAHGGGYFTFYKHNQSLLKPANTFVKHGEPIALLGNTGAMSHGPHLHFEIWKDGVARDPGEYVLNFHLY